MNITQNQDLPKLLPSRRAIQYVRDNRVTRRRTDPPSRLAGRDTYQFRIYPEPLADGRPWGTGRGVTALATELQDLGLIAVGLRVPGDLGSMFGEFLVALTGRGNDVLVAAEAVRKAPR